MQQLGWLKGGRRRLGKFQARRTSDWEGHFHNCSCLGCFTWVCMVFGVDFALRNWMNGYCIAAAEGRNGKALERYWAGNPVGYAVLDINGGGSS